jgi:hypothetical protein
MQEYTPLTRKELQEAHMIELQKKKKQHLDGLDHYVNRYIYDPIKRISKEGGAMFQFQFPGLIDYCKTKEDWEYIVKRIRTLFPDCDIDIGSYEDQIRLKVQPMSTISWK